MPEEKLEYTISTQSRGKAYSTVTKKMTKKQFNAYYDGVVANGGKVIGFTTKPLT